MKLDKKLIYRQILQLQSFAFIYHQWQRMNSSKYYLFECTKLFKDQYGNTQKSITYFMSEDKLPKPMDFNIFAIDIQMMSENDIKQNVALCKSYGISI